MKLYLVRHGHPDYAQDCLTELGHQQAEACAIAMQDIPISVMYSSSCGRAYETALHLATKKDLPVTQFDCFREVCWGVDHFMASYHPWKRTAQLVSEGVDLMHYDENTEPYWHDTMLEKSYATVIKGIDEVLEKHGYVREGASYRCVHKSNEHIALYSHGGVTACLLSHLLNLPPLYCFYHIKINYTSICVLEFNGEEGTFVAPWLSLYNDAKHIDAIENTFGR